MVVPRSRAPDPGVRGGSELPGRYMALELLTYKPDQGRGARLVSFGALAVLSWYGVTTLYDFLSWEWSRAELGFTIPVVEIPVTPAFLIAAAVLIASLVGLRVLLNHPRVADLLIDTEGEMRRVTWPSWPETLNGSIVVIVAVIALLIVLSSADLVLSRFFEHVVF
jgi:preprotein translocase SecE subunit